MVCHRVTCASLMWLCGFLLAAMTIAPAVESAGPAGWHIVGQVGGPTSAIAVQGDYAYVGVGLRLLVLDVTNPAAPAEVGATAPFPYFVEDIALSGMRAYVAAGGAGLRVVDISDPASPIELGAWDSPGYAEGVAVAGSTVYLADGPYGLWVVDVADPTNPTPNGSAYKMNYAFEVAVSGNHAYIAAAGAGLLVADVSDPAQPVEVGALDTPGYAYGIAVSDDIAHVADAWGGLHIIDVSNPADPSLWGTCATPGWALDVAMSGTTAFVADGTGGLWVVHASDPANPYEVGAYEGEGLFRRLAVADGSVYVADPRHGLLILDVTEAAQPELIGRYSPLADARRVAVAGGYAYVAAGFSGLRVIDVLDPYHPVEIGAYDIEGNTYASAVAVSGTYAYLTTYIGSPSGLLVVDVSNPADPIQAGTLFTDPYAAYRDLALQEQTIYAVNEWGLRLVDVSNPVSPTLMGFAELSPLALSANGVAVSGDRAYVANGADGLHIVDISEPFSPTLVSTYDSSGYAADIALSNTRAYMADSLDGLAVVDVSAPEHPGELGLYDTPGNAEDVAISGTIAYVGDGGGGVLLIDAANPMAPTLLDAYDTPGYAWDVTLSGNYAYIADGHGGLLILGRSHQNATKRTETVPRTAPRRLVHQELAGVRPSTVEPLPPFFTNGIFSGPAGTCVVTGTADSGPGTLRACLAATSSGDTITFDTAVFPTTSPAVINLISELPPLTQGGLLVDASNAGVILDGSHIQGNANGLCIPSDGNTVRGLQIVHFATGIAVGGSANVIGGDRLQGTGPLGQGNLVSNNGRGIHINGEYANNNWVSGNLVGTDLTGTASLGNDTGLQISGQASGNHVGGPSAGTRNLFSGNIRHGININEYGTRGNIVAGNYIGTDLSGAHPLGNGDGGVVIQQGASSNVIGGTTSKERNVISGQIGGCGNGGILLGDPGTAHNMVIGNWIGTDAGGEVALGNDHGVRISSAGYNCVAGNLISGNGIGVSIHGLGADHNLVTGNRFGTNAGGVQAIPNGTGVSISIAGFHDLIGGLTDGERNVISASQGAGVELGDAGVEYNFVIGNYIGTGAGGVPALGNSGPGVLLQGSSLHCIVQSNTIAYNGGSGVRVAHSLFNTLRANTIHSHTEPGIKLEDNGNNSLPAPVILAATNTTVSGIACPGCIVELFSDEEDEGEVYEGDAVADGSGNWTWTGSLAGPYVTATATDEEGNTSAFSIPQRVWQREVYLPVVIRR